MDALCTRHLGAEELNLSSDVDLIIVSQGPTAPKNLSALKSFSKILSENTEYGFAFRVDYDLRPGGRMAPLLFSIEQAEDFFGLKLKLGYDWLMCELDLFVAIRRFKTDTFQLISHRFILAL